MSTYFIVGLGNPGQQYNITRHNIGWMLIDEIANSNRCILQLKNKEKAYLGDFHLQGHKVILCKPITYMNLSGEAVQPLMAYYNVPLENLLVLSDDVTLDFGRSRLRTQGSSGGQKGIQSIIKRMGSQDFSRLRMGIGPKREGQDLASFVLQRFPKNELEALPEFLDTMRRGVERFITQDADTAIAYCNSYRLPGFAD